MVEERAAMVNPAEQLRRASDSRMERLEKSVDEMKGNIGDLKVSTARMEVLLTTTIERQDESLKEFKDSIGSLNKRVNGHDRKLWLFSGAFSAITGLWEYFAHKKP